MFALLPAKQLTCVLLHVLNQSFKKRSEWTIWIIPTDPEVWPVSPNIMCHIQSHACNQTSASKKTAEAKVNVFKTCR